MLLTRPLDPDSGSQQCTFHFALQKAVAVKVSTVLMELSKCVLRSLLKTLCTGVVTSPNHPVNYPNNLEKTETIQVEQGLIISIEFTAFNIAFQYGDPTCPNDHLTITDGDGTTLMEKSCGSTSDGNVVIGGESIGSSLPPAIRSRTNTVNLVFITDSDYAYSGWSVSWRAVAGINHQPS